MPWLQRKLAEVVFTAPPSSSYDEVGSDSYIIRDHASSKIMVDYISAKSKH